MLDELVIQPDDNTPIFQQLENQLLRFIHSGRLQPGQELPSVRAMASHLAINPMTVSKTINKLVEAGWLERRRGRPTCVASKLPSKARVLVDQQINTEVERLVKHAQQLGMQEEELITLLHNLWNKEI